VVILIAITPVYLVIRASGASAESWDLILRGRTLILIGNTLGLAAAVTATATVIGVAAAWLVVRSDLPGRPVWGVLFALPLVIPSYVGAFLYQAAFGPKGLVQGWLQPLGVDRLPDLSGFPGAWLTLTLFTYPYVYLPVAAALRDLDPAWEEAARTLGRGRRETFRSVVVPLLRPVIAGGGSLVALYVIHDFGAVSIMRFPTLTQAIFLQYKAAFDRAPAAILSLVLLALALLVVRIEHRTRGRRSYHRTGAGAARAPSRTSLGSARGPALAFAAVLAVLAVLGPAAVLVYLLVAGLTAGVPLNFTVGAGLATILAGAAGAAACVVAAAPVAVVAARYPGTSARRLEAGVYMGYALPGLVVALAFVSVAAGWPLLYQSLPLLVLAYVVLFLPQAVEPLKGGLLSLDPRLSEAGRTLGRNRRYVTRHVLLPALARPAAVAAALVCLTVMKELPATILLRPTGFETLATRVWTSASAGLYSRAAVPALLLIALAAVPLAFLSARLGSGTEPR
jgi:iron(III) transport system permease protein